MKFYSINSPKSLVDFESPYKFYEKFSDSECDLVDPQFQKFCSNWFLCKNDGSCDEVILLRDSGSLQSLVQKDVLRPDEFVDTTEVRLIVCVDGMVTERFW